MVALHSFIKRRTSPEGRRTVVYLSSLPKHLGRSAGAPYYLAALIGFKFQVMYHGTCRDASQRQVIAGFYLGVFTGHVWYRQHPAPAGRAYSVSRRRHKRSRLCVRSGPGSYSMAATLPGTPSLSLLKSIIRVLRLAPPPLWRVVINAPAVASCFSFLRNKQRLFRHRFGDIVKRYLYHSAAPGRCRAKCL